MLQLPRLLTAARVLAGLTQAELAHAAGVATSVLQALEQGRSDPKLSTVIAIFQALRARGVAVTWEPENETGTITLLSGGRAERLAPKIPIERH
ncbi:helix-turn-helix transcriptional regulator [Falsiroseomonas sp.]|uniref:helix-turn-helix transcriptional regulator n=1 Tax=Falsiroseomonas sp. TaxID=2870721 RepID=UPI003F718080